MSDSSTARPTLRIVRGPMRGQSFPIDREITVLGRDPSCDIVLASPAASRRHARISRGADGFDVEDLGSTQGTWINNRPLHGSVRLDDGDQLRMGDCLIAFSEKGEARLEAGGADSTILGVRDSSGTGEWALVGVRPEEKLRAILQISRDLGGSLDWDEVLGRILDGLFRLFPRAERGFVLLVEDGQALPVAKAIKLRHPGPSRPNLSRTVLDYVMKRGKAILSEDLLGDVRFEQSRSVDDAGLRTLMCVPLRDRSGRSVGAIQIDTSAPRAGFTADDLDLLVAVAGQVGLALDNARLYREAQEALRRRAESQAFIDAMLAAAPVAVAFLDEGLRYVRVNQAMAALNGRPAEEHQGRGLGEIRSGVTPLIEPMVRSVLETGEPLLGVEIDDDRPDGGGSPRRLRGYCYPARGPDGRSAGIGVLLEDVTEARGVQERLRASEERYRLLFESNPHPMWAYDVETLRFLAVNEAAIERYGYSREEFLGMTIADIRPPEDVPRMRDRVVATRTATYLNQTGWRHVTRDGRLLDVEISSHSLEFDGRPARLVLASDISRRLRAESEVRAAKEAAEAANLAKDRFLAVLSHELRTPLTPVLLSVSSLLDEGRVPGDLRAALEMVRRNVELEARLVDDLLDVARIGRGTLQIAPEVMDVHQAAREAVEICLPEIRAAALRVEFDLAAQRRHASADPARLKQVFWNLIRNAAKFTPPGGSLTIRSRNEGEARPDGSGRGLVLEFLDTGVGIEPESLDRIFEPFEQGDSARLGRQGGLGLGLAISRTIAEAHGGRLTASSAGRGRGTAFRLDLEAVDPPSPAKPAGDATPSVAKGPAGVRVLLVEDNKDTLHYLALVLRHRGFEVVTAAGVDPARASAASAPSAFDLLISDIELPDGTGLELMRELAGRRVASGIAMSGFGSEDDVRMSLAAGFADHLTKPIDVRRLEAAIAKVLAAGRD